MSASCSPAIEDYLKAIYVLHQDYHQVTTSRLSEHLDVAPPSVSAMLQKLAKLDLVSYTPYHGVALTERGQRIALEVLRHHRLLELYLVKELGYSWEEVHAEAEVLEHVISERLEARIAARLDHPTVDPHGDPIPYIDGTLPSYPCQPLSQLALELTGRVVRVTNQQPDRLQYLAGLGVIPGAIVIVHARAPFDGPLTLDIGGATHYLDIQLAQAILVEAIRKDADMTHMKEDDRV